MAGLTGWHRWIGALALLLAAFRQFGVITKDVSGDLDKYFDQAILKTVMQ